MTKSAKLFDVDQYVQKKFGDFVIFLWPSQNIRTLLNIKKSEIIIFQKIPIRIPGLDKSAQVYLLGVLKYALLTGHVAKFMKFEEHF